MRILMLASEVRPLAMSGGLADVIPSLSNELKRRGHDVRILMPRYYGIDTEEFDMPALLSIPSPVGEYTCKLYKTCIGENDVAVYLLEKAELYNRKGLYGPDGSSDWADNDLRFSLLCHAALAMCEKIHWKPHVFHLHDWQTAPLAWLLKTSVRHAERREFSSCRSLLTIHNLGYQGIFEYKARNLLNPHAPVLPDEDKFREWEIDNPDSEGLPASIKKNTFSFLATGIAWADKINTVSPTYAREILLPEYSHGLQELLLNRLDSLSGILNGIDYNSWNPAADKQLIPYNYNRFFTGSRKRLKARLQREFGLNENPRTPLFGMISRFAQQKGFQLIAGQLNAMQSRYKSATCSAFTDGRAQLAILGTGETIIESALQKLNRENAGQISVKIGFDDGLARKMAGGCDYFLMPSLYEPCGLNQLYSLRYGSIPVVRKTGGLADTVQDFTANAEMQSGSRGRTGIVFSEASPEALAQAIERAIALYPRYVRRRLIQFRGMTQRFDWKQSAQQYERLYAELHN